MSHLWLLVITLNCSALSRASICSYASWISLKISGNLTSNLQVPPKACHNIINITSICQLDTSEQTIKSNHTIYFCIQLTVGQIHWLLLSHLHGIHGSSSDQNPDQNIDSSITLEDHITLSAVSTVYFYRIFCENNIIRKTSRWVRGLASHFCCPHKLGQCFWTSRTHLTNKVLYFLMCLTAYNVCPPDLLDNKTALCIAVKKSQKIVMSQAHNDQD